MYSNNVDRRKALRIGMIGGGVVGGGVYELIGRLGSTSLNNSAGRPCMITKLCVKDATKTRNFTIDTSVTEVVTDVHLILEDTSIDIVIEVMGGTTVAKMVVEECLKKKKAVVTANKDLIAGYIDSLQALAKENGTILAYEGAVCGGIPIVTTLQSCYTGDVITEVVGVCNGTTNYILGQMEEQGSEYNDVLRAVQNGGYNRAFQMTDPSADVATLCLLTRLAFGTTVLVEQVPCRGIADITQVDFEYAKLLGCTIKLVATAKRLPKNVQYDGPLSVYVLPALLPKTHVLASSAQQNNVNAVAISSVNTGTCSYTGPGAGRFPTANSIVSDVVRIANGQASGDPFPLAPSYLELDSNYVSSHYVRIPFQDSLGIVSTIGQLAEEFCVSIHSILQNAILDKREADFCITTDECTSQQIQGFCEAVAEQEFCRSFPLSMPLLTTL